MFFRKKPFTPPRIGDPLTIDQIITTIKSDRAIALKSSDQFEKYDIEPNHVYYYEEPYIIGEDFTVVEQTEGKKKLEKGKIYIDFKNTSIFYWLLGPDNKLLVASVLYKEVDGLKKLGAMPPEMSEKNKILEALNTDETLKKAFFRHIKAINGARIHYRFMKDGKETNNCLEKTLLLNQPTPDNLAFNLLQAINRPPNLFFEVNDSNHKLLQLLEGIDKNYQNEDVLHKLNDYLLQLDLYQRAFMQYDSDANPDNREQLRTAVINLRNDAEALRRLLVNQPARIASTIAALIGASIGLALAPLAFIAGIGVSLLLVGMGTSQRTMKRSDTHAFFVLALAFLSFPYYSLIKGAGIGHRLAENALSSEPRAFNEFRKESLEEVNKALYDKDDEALADVEASWLNGFEFDSFKLKK